MGNVSDLLTSMTRTSLSTLPFGVIDVLKLNVLSALHIE